MLFTIAVPVGILLHGFSGGWERLSDAVFVLTGGIDNFELHRWTSRMATHLVLPTLAVFLVLRLTRLGSWLAPNRLALGALLMADALILGYWVHGVALAAIGRHPYPSFSQSEVLNAVLIGSVSVGLVVLLASTLWHRCIPNKDRARHWSGVLLREV
jgi:hypothetical protein